MKNHIVVSVYNEDIKWVQYINPHLYEVYIYNKGNPDTLNTHNVPCHINHLANIGRESHTYLYHIIEHYDCLPDKIVFTQGNPFDHVRGSFIEEVNQLFNSDFHYFSKSVLTIKNSERKGILEESGLLNGSMWINHHKYDCFQQVIEKVYKTFDTNCVHFEFGTGAIFGVNKQTIHQHSKHFYIQCINILKESANIVNPSEGHMFERLWKYIFTRKSA